MTFRLNPPFFLLFFFFFLIALIFSFFKLPKSKKKHKGTQCCVHLYGQQYLKTNECSLLLCKKLSFLSEKFRVLCKYKAKVAIGAIEGTVQEGSIPTRVEVVFVITFLAAQSSSRSVVVCWLVCVLVGLLVGQEGQ